MSKFDRFLCRVAPYESIVLISIFWLIVYLILCIYTAFV